MKILLNLYRFILLIIAAWKGTFDKTKAQPENGAQTTAEILDRQVSDARADNAQAKTEAHEKAEGERKKGLEELQRERKW